MSKRKRILAVLFLVLLGVSLLFLWPPPRASFEQLYAHVDPNIVRSLQAFRQANPPKHLEVDGVLWEYLALGEGEETLLFLHGMTGHYDIWWQQIETLQDQYRIISVTYPPLQRLEDLEAGLGAILDKERVETFSVIGTSLGGYFAQYLLAKHPKRIQRAVLSNTFPPNDLIAEKNRVLGALLPHLPEWLVLWVFRSNFEKVIYPTSGYDELTLAFLQEIGSYRVTKAQLVARYYCLLEKFTVPTPTVPLLIIESDNDPLVEPTLREALKATYPEARVYTFSDAGHFPFLNRPQLYNQVLEAFLRQP